MSPDSIRVVIADDEPDVRLLLRLQLESHGFEVVGEAQDGAEAIARCDQVRPDAAIIDLLMPRVTGFEAIPAIRRGHPGTALIAYTAVAGDFVRAEMAKLRVPLLLKSGDVTLLATRLRELVAERRAG